MRVPKTGKPWTKTSAPKSASRHSWWMVMSNSLLIRVVRWMGLTTRICHLTRRQTWCRMWKPATKIRKVSSICSWVRRPLSPQSIKMMTTHRNPLTFQWVRWVMKIVRSNWGDTRMATAVSCLPNGAPINLYNSKRLLFQNVNSNRKFVLKETIMLERKFSRTSLR